MLKRLSVFCLILLGSTAYGQQRQAVSYFARGSGFGTTGEGITVIPNTPANFVITDLYVSREATGGTNSIFLHAGTPNPPALTDRLFEQRVGAVLFYETHFQSGLRIPANLALWFAWEGTIFNDVTVNVSGYIETQPLSGNAPAVSTWGLVMLGLLIVTAGTIAAMYKSRLA